MISSANEKNFTYSKELNSSSSITTNNLLEGNNEDNFDLFGSNGFSTNSKFFNESNKIDEPNKEINDEFKKVILRKSSNENLLNEFKESSISKNLNKNFILQNELDGPNKLKSLSKVIIYDNNLPNRGSIANEPPKKENESQVSFKTQVSTTSSKSKSCETLDQLEQVVNDTEIDKKQPNNESSTKIITNENTEVKKQLAYSKSLKLIPTSTGLNKVEVSLKPINELKKNTETNSDTNPIHNVSLIRANTKIEARSNMKSEPIWKELAFKKQNAW